MTAQATGVPAALVHNLRYNKVLHERVIFVTVIIADIPWVPEEERVSVQPMGD